MLDTSDDKFKLQIFESITIIAQIYFKFITKWAEYNIETPFHKNIWYWKDPVISIYLFLLRLQNMNGL